MKENAIQLGIRLALGREDGCAVYRNNVGAAEFLAPDGRVQHVKFGLAPGSGDLIGCVTKRPLCPSCGAYCAPVGVFTSLEVKQPGRYPTAEQRMFAELIERLGGVAKTVRSPDEALEVVRAIR
jgi:hypothetical protein